MLVTTGRLVGGAALQAREYNDRVRRHGEPRFETWDRDILRGMLVADPACGLAAGSPGDLLALLGAVDQRARVATAAMLTRQPGAAHPVSDRWAISLIPAVLAAAETQPDAVEDYLRRVIKWTADAYEHGL